MAASDVSRRSFLRGAGVVAAASVAMMAGCSPQNESKGSNVEAESWDGEYDVIAVGAGFAGLAVAATVATEGDGATCLLLEKDVAANGNSPFCFGGVMCGEDYDEMLMYLRTLLDDEIDDATCEVFAKGACENKQWLMDLGVEESWFGDAVFLSEYPEFRGGERCSIVYLNPANETGFKHAHTFLTDLVSHSDCVDFKTRTPFESFVMDPETKGVLGVVADGKRYKANKGVVMCIGGFESNPEMMKQYAGVGGAKPVAGKANTGDGHRACMAIGTDMWHMKAGAQFWMAPRNLDNTEFVSQAFDYAPKEWGITVGVHGRRFYNDFDGCTKMGPNPDIPATDIRLSVGYRHGLTNFGGSWSHLPFPDTGWFIFDQAAYDEAQFLDGYVKNPLETGWMVQADSIEELAGKIDVPEDELVRTIEVWNGYCDKGHDDAFYRPSDTLRPIKTAPFNAIRCAPTMLNTDGGPVRNSKAQILYVDGTPVPGLYSAGEFGSVWGHYYQAAGNVSECLVFGRTAARNALGIA